MHVEVRKKGKTVKYYLAHAYRRGAKSEKLRVYLGKNLSAGQLGGLRQKAEATLTERIRAQASIGDPFETVLSPRELKELQTLEALGEIRALHLSEAEWRRFTEMFTCDTNAIEGSTVNLRDVEGILERNRWPDKPKGDISETYGVANAVDFIRKTNKEHISLPLILELHRLVFENSKTFAGKLRKRGVEVVVADAFGAIVHRGAPSTLIRRLLGNLVKWYLRNKSRYPPLVLAAVVHNQFENIHPFQDGNGRVGRLLMNNILIKHGRPPINIELRNRREYYAALQAYENEHNLRPTVELMIKEYRALKRLLLKTTQKKTGENKG